MGNGSEMLDITREVCPMTFVRTKIRLEKMADGSVLTVWLREGEALVNVPRAVTDHGHEILRLDRRHGDVFELVIRKRGSRQGPG